MTAIGRMVMVSDSNPHPLLMQIRESNVAPLSRLSSFSDKNPSNLNRMAFVNRMAGDFQEPNRRRASSDGNSESNDDGDVDMSDDGILEVDDNKNLAITSSINNEPVNAARALSVEVEIKIEKHSPRSDSISPKSISSSNQEIPMGLPKIDIAPAMTKSTNFSIDHILRSDFGTSAASSVVNSRKSSQSKAAPRHRKFDFSVEALAAQCWSGSVSSSSSSPYYATGGFSPPPTSSRHGAPSPSSVSTSPASSVSPTLSISPSGARSISTSSSGVDLGQSPIRSPLSSPNTSPPRHYRSHRTTSSTPTITPTMAAYPCNPSVLMTLQQQNQHQQSYFQHLINATATTHELLASQAAGYHQSPYSTGAPTILTHRYPITDKLSSSTGANHRESTITYNRNKVSYPCTHRSMYFSVHVDHL